MTSRWPPLPYEAWSATCDTVHSHTQVLGKLAVALAPPEPQLQHAALHLSGRGWETLPLPAPDWSGAMVVALDMHTHHAVAEHSDGRVRRIPLTPDRPVAEVTGELLAAVGELVGPVRIDPRPQETPWTTPLDQDFEHATYDPTQVTAYFSAATQAALVLSALRAPYRGRSTPVNAWWGTFDLAVSLYSGQPVDPPSNDFITRNSGNAQQIEVGWWPGDARYPRPAFFAFAFPTPDGFETATLSPPAAHWDSELGEYILDWDGVRVAPDPHRAALDFGLSAIRHACTVCGWDPDLAASAQGLPPPRRVSFTVELSRRGLTESECTPQADASDSFGALFYSEEQEPMAVQLNHHIVHASDPETSARFLADILGLDPPVRYGPFMAVETANGVGLDYMRVEGEITPNHYAFLVTEDEFDQIFGRIREQGLDIYADPHAQRPGEINHHDGGRGVYWADPDGHWPEIITRPYGSGDT